jgi:hypothetical protein
MRKSVAALTGAVFGVALSAPAFLKTESVTGQLIDLACYAQDKANTGNQHKNRGLICAQACAREGFPVGLLTAAGRVYQVTGSLAADSNAKLAPHMAHTVTLTGDVSEKDGQLTIAASNLKMSQ